MLLDRCPKCSGAIAFHRLDMAGAYSLEIGPIAYCHACDFDLRDAPREEPISYDTQASALLMQISRDLDVENVLGNSAGEWDLGRYAVMHQLCGVMASRYTHVHLREFVLDQVESQDTPLTGGYVSFEMRPIEERHHLAQLTAWLLLDLESRLTTAWRARAVRYNVLLKDFTDIPVWYVKIVAKFSRWRDRLDNSR